MDVERRVGTKKRNRRIELKGESIEKDREKGRERRIRERRLKVSNIRIQIYR